jgi:hypothetical protein
MGFTKERNSMSDENKNKAGLPDKKVMGLFYFGVGWLLSFDLKLEIFKKARCLSEKRRI